MATQPDPVAEKIRDVEAEVNQQIQQARMYRWMRAAALCTDKAILAKIESVMCAMEEKEPANEDEFDAIIIDAMLAVPL